ncbi:Alpha/beta hydrolase family-domain-containing protein [Panaeolus papilionaceus]|nr:Alpha/beta hydrolase family-domain-containing protein [Panaeolus papilionaceus]
MPSPALRFGNVVIPIFIALFSVFFAVNFFERKLAYQIQMSSASLTPSNVPSNMGINMEDRPPIEQTPHTRSHFYIGGSYVQATHDQDKSIISGQMYVERLTPLKVIRPYPIVILPGSCLTGAHFLKTADERPGWADYFLSQGYEVYLADLPSRGRSPWQQNVDGDCFIFDASFSEEMFTATHIAKKWPQASLLTQWPGNGTKGDAIFDAFYASISPSLSSNKELSEKTTNAGVALLDKIPGPCILLTHSQSGQFGWSIADRRPSRVKAIIAVEPGGPPFINVAFPPYDVVVRPFGMTEIPVDFYPPPESVDMPLQFQTGPEVNGFACTLQATPARKMKNLGRIPVLMITAEASYHAQYDWCSAQFLRQAGIRLDHVQLSDVGIHGNGHLMYLEKNSDKIVDDVVHRWLVNRGLAS